MIIKAFHKNTFTQYLINLGIDKNKINNTTIHPATQHFNDTLMNNIKSQNICTSIACIGMIEKRYAEISNILAEKILANNWLDTSELAHYSLHKEIDLHHAELFFSIIRSEWNNSTSRDCIKVGVKLGNDLIINIYNNLLD